MSGCSRQDFKVSPINNMRDGMDVAWVKYPLVTAIRVAEKGTVTLGWTRVKIELLRKRPVQCYKCWHFGHVRPSCRSEIERKGVLLPLWPNRSRCWLMQCWPTKMPYMRRNRKRF